MFHNKLNIKILVIGASGLLGGSLMKYPIAAKQVGTYYNNKNDGLIFLDARNASSIDVVINKLNPDVILYAAGITNVDECESIKTTAYDINYKAVKYICDNFTNVKLVYYSSDYVFDGENPPYSEEDETKPANYYGLSKLKGEECVLHNNSNNLVIRVSGLYNSTRKMIAEKLILAEDDRFSRPVNILDVIRATFFLIMNNRSGLYHVAGNNTLSRYEYHQIQCLSYEEFDSENRPIMSYTKNYLAKRPKDSSLSTEKLESELFSVNKIGLCSCNAILKKRDALKLTIFVDCIGGVLADRAWSHRSVCLNEIDRLCGTIDSSNENEIIQICKNNNIHVNDVVNLYTINPYLWSYLLQWRTKYRLILVNNGWVQTFRIWVEKYCFSKLFDDVINSHEYGVRKENPHFYESLAHKSNISLKNSIIIDDDINVINTCEKLGIQPIQTIKKQAFPVNLYVPKKQELIDEI